MLLLMKRLRQQQLLQQLDGQGLALLALSLSLLQQRDIKILERIGRVLQQQQEQKQQQQQHVYVHLKKRHREGQHLGLPNQSLCLLLHAIAKLDVRETAILQIVCQRIER